MQPTRRELLILAVMVLAFYGFQAWWSARQDAALGPQVSALARDGDIRMLASETCSICGAARAWFTEHRIPFSECTIERDAACRAAFRASTSPGTPVLLVRGRTLIGFSPARVRDALT